MKLEVLHCLAQALYDFDNAATEAEMYASLARSWYGHPKWFGVRQERANEVAANYQLAAWQRAEQAREARERFNAAVEELRNNT